MQGLVGTRESEERMLALALAMAMAGEGLSLPLLMPL
jgi:hypothetical protein